LDWLLSDAECDRGYIAVPPTNGRANAALRAAAGERLVRVNVTY